MILISNVDTFKFENALSLNWGRSCRVNASQDIDEELRRI